MRNIPIAKVIIFIVCKSKMKSGTKIAAILFATVSLVSGCELIEKTKKVKIPFIDNIKVKRYETLTKDISLSCGKKGLESYIKDGWKVTNTKKEEITCSWKVKRAKKGCNLDFDKGCRIKVPDKLGQKVTYSLEKKIVK